MRKLYYFIAFVIFFSQIFDSQVFATIQGIVTYSSGDPVSGATVTFIDESNPVIRFSDDTDSQGNYEIDISGSTGVNSSLPSTFSLGQNYPNPFNPSTTIPFTLESSDHISLIIYNIMGQKIATVIDNYISAGNHTVTWDGRDDAGNHVSSGIYLYQFKDGRNTEIKKMLLLDGGRGSGVFSVAKPAYNSGFKSATKIAAGSTYTVTIIHESIIPY